MNKVIAGFVALSLLSGCATDGGVDWDKVGTGVLAAGAVVVLVGAAALAAQPNYYPTTTCWGNRWSTTCTTR